MSSSEFEPETIKAPTASGAKLKMMTTLIESSLTGAVLGKVLLKNVGVPTMRRSQATDPFPLKPPLPSSQPTQLARSMDPAELSKIPALPPTDGFRFETIADFVEAYQSGAVSPEQVAEKVLAFRRESDSLDPSMNWFISQREDDVMEQARASTQRYRDGSPLGPLDGVPCAVKDELDQVGYPTTVGTPFLGEEPAQHDAEGVRRV